MKQLLDDLLDYSRTSLDIGILIHVEPADLVSICHEEVDLLRATQETRTRRANSQPEKLPRIL